ncbi:MAG: hypothetical protein H6828_09690 [Planctomycetes bacterium]|nr:hypothetical protein [Planctomycetota bacterium]
MRIRLALLALCALTACQVGPPPASYRGPAGLVRAGGAARAAEISDALCELAPRVEALLPDAHAPELEVWVQARPALYRFEGDVYAEADGFWSETHRRIHLREAPDTLRRTLAHELVHASLGASWERLPGSLEEGLCDLVSVALAPEQAVEMRAGRLSAAAFATGGLELDVEVRVPIDAGPDGLGLGALTRLRLFGEVSEGLDPSDVFDVSAGLSSTRLATNDKKALYGLSFLLVERIVARVGYEGLHELCLRAAREERDEVPRAWLLEAAGLTDAGPVAWRRAIHGALTARELRTILMLYPEALLDTAQRLFGRHGTVAVDLSGASPVRARVTLPWSEATVELGLVVEAPALADAR